MAAVESTGDLTGATAVLGGDDTVLTTGAGAAATAWRLAGATVVLGGDDTVLITGAGAAAAPWTDAGWVAGATVVIGGDDTVLSNGAGAAVVIAAAPASLRTSKCGGFVAIAVLEGGLAT